MTDYAKPLPRVTADNRPFWEAARRHALALERCDDCGHFRYPPAPVCPECLSERATWTPVSGRGVVTTFVVVHKPYFPSFAADLPRCSSTRAPGSPRISWESPTPTCASARASRSCSTTSPPR